MSRDFKPGIKITRTADISRHYWFPRELTSGERAQKALYSTYGVQIVALSLVKPVIWFARAVVN